MYFEPIDCTVEEAEENKKRQIKMLERLLEELRSLYERQAELEGYDLDDYEQEELNIILEKIDSLECCAANREREIDYWDTQARWARKRAEQNKEKEK
jgi:hypothetical protein